MNLISIFKEFPSEEKCIKFLEKKRWKDGIKCPYCESDNTNKLVKENRHHCNGCRKSFSVTVGTIFHHTHLELQKWFLAIALITNAKKGISSRQLARDLDLPVKTAWSISMRIRKAMKEKNKELFAGIVEMDETYIKTDKDDDDKTGGGSKRSQNNTPVVGIAERNGKINVFATKDIKAKTLLDLAMKSIELGATLHTDSNFSYRSFRSHFNHECVKHAVEYVSKSGVHCNSVESFWGLFKRGIQGQFHHISRKYIQKYIDEFEFRFNNRANGFEKLINNCLQTTL